MSDTSRLVWVFFAVLFLVLVAGVRPAGPLLHRDTTLNATSRSNSSIDANGNVTLGNNTQTSIGLVFDTSGATKNFQWIDTNSAFTADGHIALSAGGKLTSVGQLLLLESASGYNTEMRSPVGNAAAISYGNGSQTAFYADDTTGNVLVRIKGTSSTGALQSSTGSARFSWLEGQSAMNFSGGSAAVYALDSNGYLVLHGRTGYSGGVAIQNIEANVNMVMVDPGDNGNIQLRAQAPGDVITLQDGAGTTRISIGDDTGLGVNILDGGGTVSLFLGDSGGNGEVELRPVASGDQVILRDSTGAARVRVGNTQGITIQNAANTVSMAVIDNGADGDIYFRPNTTGDYFRVRDGANITRLAVTDTATNSYHVSVSGNLSTTGTLRVDNAVRVFGDEFVTDSTFNATPAVNYIYCDTTSNSITVNLPATATSVGAEYLIKLDTKGGSNTVTVDANGSETIGGALTQTILNEGDSLKIRCPSTGTDWKIADQFAASGITPLTVGSRARRTTNYGIAATMTEIAGYDTEDFDAGSDFNTTTGRFTAPTNGYYQINGTINLNSAGSAVNMTYAILKNGSAVSSVAMVNNAGSEPSPGMFLADLLYLSATEYVSLGAAVTGTANATSIFSVIKVHD